MDRVMMVGGAMLLVGLGLAVVFVVLTNYASSFEMFQDNITRFVERIF
ncbi:MAG TPA: hypothetical protein VEK34_00690 [Methylocella sp.]|nr:hypothetical protein [Methylocella sp.]